MDKIEEYYNKFNEEKRLTRRRGIVEYRTSFVYIHECLLKLRESGRAASDIRILDIGAGCGAYTIPLHEEGFDVTAVEYVKHNVGILKKKCPEVKAYQGDARNMKKYESGYYDLILLFGPMYHLFGEDKDRALLEATRLLAPGGFLLIAYCMNEYSIITYGFKERHILEAKADGHIDDTYHVRNAMEDLYDYVRIEDIDRLKGVSGLSRYKIINADGPANYMRRELNALSDDEFEEFMNYHLSVCERYELLGAAGHVVDVLKK
ncbi:MAG TPA: SAM-dependent methyltransferase [Eubacterium sp.]|nr:SAM-dependent methyltransferase [Eubacterium sp.]